MGQKIINEVKDWWRRFSQIH